MIMIYSLLFLLTLTFGVGALQREVCVDRTFRCALWSQYCDDKYNRDFMQTNCKKTCAWCPKCEDLIPDCGMFDCDEKSNEAHLRKNCRLTCGACVPPTLPPPTPPKPTWKVIAGGKCGMPKVKTERIIGGKDAQKGAWPWQVLIKREHNEHCGGSIISPFWVVTAAHCVHKQQVILEHFRVVTGENDFSFEEGDETSIKVTKMIVHEKFSPKTLDNDIALLKLDRPIPFGKFVGTVCLPEQEDEIIEGKQCVITGWGKTNIRGAMHHRLQEARMPIVNNDKCSNLNTNNTHIKVTPRMLCAGSGPDSFISGCHGDSGGPFVCLSGGRWILQGVVSWGSVQCESKEAYTVFARVSQLRDWIDKNMRE